MDSAPAIAESSFSAVLPAIIAQAGEHASWRFLEFFTVNIRNPNTRAAYTVAARSFLGWCEENGMRTLADVKPVHVAAYIDQHGTVVKRVVRLGNALIGPRRSRIEVGRTFHLQGLVRSFPVKFFNERVELRLLLKDVGASGPRGFLVQR